LTKLADRTHGRERTLDELGRASPVRRVGGLRLKELRISQHDSELIIQAVMEHLQLLIVRRLVGTRAVGRGRHAQA
jgi:hypothetical protein